MGNLLGKKIYDLTKFNDKEIYKQVNTSVVFLGLNVSGQELDTFSNFHGTNTSNHQSLRFVKRIRDVFVGTQYYGGYMTDIIKNFAEPDSVKMNNHLKDDKEFEKENIETFKQELEDIGGNVKIIIAFGNSVQNLLKKYKFEEKYHIINIRHYSSIMKDEDYITQVKKQLSEQKYNKTE